MFNKDKILKLEGRVNQLVSALDVLVDHMEALEKKLNLVEEFLNNSNLLANTVKRRDKYKIFNRP